MLAVGSKFLTPCVFGTNIKLSSLSRSIGSAGCLYTEWKGSSPKKALLITDRNKAIQVKTNVPWVEPALNVDDIQGDALCGFHKPHLAILAIEIADDTSATIHNTKKWLTDSVIPNVTSARDVIHFRELYRLMGNKQNRVAQIGFNVSFSYDALLKLAPPEEVNKFYRPGMVRAYKIGLPPRSTYLNDPEEGEGANENWKVGAKKNPHILIQIAADRKSLIQEEIDCLEAGLTSCSNPAKITYKEFGNKRDDHPGHEHFGFHDGISNPGVRGTYKTEGTDGSCYITPRWIHEDDPRSDYYGLPGQQLVWPGEFILGLPKQNRDTTSDSDTVHDPGSTTFVGPEWAKNGTFLVYRRLKQDVTKFWKFMKESAAKIVAEHPDLTHVTEEHVGAKVMARWTSGAPVIRQPTADDPAMGVDPLAHNAFFYQEDEDPFLLKPTGKPDRFPEGDPDPLGKVCPLSAHLRKVQPRDEGTDIGGSLLNLQRRIIRRGIEYGDPIKDVMVDDGKDRGLMFICYQANIDSQFEFLITHWANSPSNPRNGGGHDMVIGQSDDKNRERSFDVPLPDGTVFTLKTTDEWVIPTGGGYFFVPSISALKNVIAK